MHQWLGQAPANIALIKYMGKKDESKNIPANPSLSYTLNDLLSNVSLEVYPGKKDFWEPLHTPGVAEFTLSEEAQTRFLNHLAFLKSEFNYTGAFIVRSCNNFPHSSGLASSASSFAALTKCAVLALSELTQVPLPSIEIQADLSRVGSGSSCRSFFSPWALWDEEHVTAIDLPYQKLHHEVVIISHDVKKVSSSRAHQLIKTSPLYNHRNERASENLRLLLDALKYHQWQEAYQICWQEFQDMHELFPSCAQPFSYINERTQEVLNHLQSLWQREGDGPIITMDAGPNVHVLYRLDQVEMARQFKQDYLIGNFDVL
ncbi:MAG: diphosphomevalonate decarboxylase [Legionellaceae bacterium]|nr:diphosphomevalonate decarboxylase [Legionellaceae bacterium]